MKQELPSPFALHPYLIPGDEAESSSCSPPSTPSAPQAMKRKLILPPLQCWSDRYWNMLDGGRFPGVKPDAHPLPFHCPFDHLFDNEKWAHSDAPIRECATAQPAHLLPIAAVRMIVAAGTLLPTSCREVRAAAERAWRWLARAAWLCCSRRHGFCLRG
jgi:hypothetical protein